MIMFGDMEEIIDLVPIEGFDGYFVNGDGKVFSTLQGTMREVSANRRLNGVWVVQLYRNGSKHPVAVHRLVAEAFVPNPNGYRYVLFRDGDRDNLSAENLYWNRTKSITARGKWYAVPGMSNVYMTRNGNVRFGDTVLDVIRHSDGNPRVNIPWYGVKIVGLLHAMTFVKKVQTPKPKRAILEHEQVAEIKALYQPRVKTMQELADKYNVSVSTIRDVISGRSWGYVKPAEIGGEVVKKSTTVFQTRQLFRQGHIVEISGNVFGQHLSYLAEKEKNISVKISENQQNPEAFLIQKIESKK